MLLTVVSSGSTRCSCSFKHNASLDSLHTSTSLSALLVHISSLEVPRWDTTLSCALKASYWNCQLQELLIPCSVSSSSFFFWFLYLGHICQYILFPEGWQLSTRLTFQLCHRSVTVGQLAWDTVLFFNMCGCSCACGYDLYECSKGD